MDNFSKWVQSANDTLKKKISTNNLGFSSSSNQNQPQNFNKNWIHPPDVLTNHRVHYTVKFMGDVSVDQPKGTEVIKDAIRRLRFHLEVKRSQGFKLPRMELQINLDGVSIVDPKSQRILHKYPLHRISFCADDKNDKRLFAFIAKQSGSTSLNNNNDGFTLGAVSRKGSCSSAGSGIGLSKWVNPDTTSDHRCFVFLSDKLAEEITLTIGEAFDLAYRRFLDHSGRDLETKRSNVILRKRIQELERENAALKEQLAMQQRLVSQQHAVPDIVGPKSGSPVSPKLPPANEKKAAQDSLEEPKVGAQWERFDSNYGLCAQSVAPKLPTSPIPPPPPCSGGVTIHKSPPYSAPDPNNKPSLPNNNDLLVESVEQKRTKSYDSELIRDLSLATSGPEILIGRTGGGGVFIDDEIFDQDFDPRAVEIGHNANNTILGESTAIAQYKTLTNQNGPKPVKTGFSTGKPDLEVDFDRQIRRYDTKLAEMREGYKSGLSFGRDDFDVSDLDFATLNPKEFQQMKEKFQKQQQQQEPVKQ